ncbi:hypothetical protein J4Q44_G00389740 [Coregonus suidteri]|uniref:Uncharacterized protein n=1 Tax=Coregonus suidteri TaxID=861788 RepID=A0AAN8Q4B2_9TELE
MKYLFMKCEYITMTYEQLFMNVKYITMNMNISLWSVRAKNCPAAIHPYQSRQ